MNIRRMIVIKWFNGLFIFQIKTPFSLITNILYQLILMIIKRNKLYFLLLFYKSFKNNILLNLKYFTVVRYQVTTK